MLENAVTESSLNEKFSGRNMLRCKNISKAFARQFSLESPYFEFIYER